MIDTTENILITPMCFPPVVIMKLTALKAIQHYIYVIDADTEVERRGSQNFGLTDT